MKAKSKCSNPFWKEVYTLLIEYRLNVLLNHPAEYRYIPINGKPSITCNNIPVRQEWAQNKCLDTIIDHKGNLKRLNEINCSKKLFDYEYKELKRILDDFLGTYLGSRLGANRREGTTNYSECGGHNIYGCIVTKSKKGSSYYYSLLNTHAKNKGLVSCSLKMESEAFDEGMNWDCIEYDTLVRVKHVYRTPYFNRLKQFY